jgi:tetratricopeptide (TPR) repeat protein
MAPSSQDYQVTVQRAQEALAAGDHRAALTLLDQAIRLEPRAPAAFVLLGRTYMALERYADASGALARGADLAGGISSPQGPDVLNLLALSLAREEKNTEALALLDQLVEARPLRPAVWLLRGRLHLALGRAEAAKADFQREIQLQARRGSHPDAPAPPHSPLAAAWEGLGVSAYRLGDDTLAFEALRRAPESQEARLHLALTLARMGRHAEAVEAYQWVLARAPRDRAALQGLARSAAALGQDDLRRQALSTLEALYRLEEEQRSARVKVSSLRTRAFARAAAGDARGATADLEQAVRLAPDDVDLRLDFGRTLSLAGDRRRGADVLRGLIRDDALNAEAHYHLGRLLLEEDPAAAAATLETASRLAPLKPDYHQALAEAYARLGDTGRWLR